MNRLMEKLLRWVKHGAWILVPGTLGDIFVILGIITAVMDTRFAGFTPTVWLLLALAAYLYMISCIILRMLSSTEAKA